MDQVDKKDTTQSAWEYAGAYGVDLSLLEENLRKSADELILQQSNANNSVETLRSAMLESSRE